MVAGLLLSGNETTGGHWAGFEAGPDPSIYNDRGSGSRALYELSSRLGYSVQVSKTNWRSLPDDARMMVCVAPDVRPPSGLFGGTGDSSAVLTGSDAAGMIDWLKPGRTLFLMADDLPAPATAGIKSASGNFGDVFGVTIGSSLYSRVWSYLSPMQPVGVVRGVNCICVHGEHRVRRIGNDGVVLFGKPPAFRRRGPVGGEPSVLTYAVGKGRVYVVADGFFACNANLARVNNAVFVTNILSEAVKPGDRILFDEYHHGDITDTHSVWSALGAPARHGIIQLLVAAVAMALVLAPRFGTPQPSADRTRRNSAEYVASLASLYRSAHAATPALDFIYRQFLRDLCARLALPSDISLAQLADAAGRRGQVDAVELKKLMGSCEQHLSTQSVTESEMLELVRKMEQFRKEMGID